MKDKWIELVEQIQILIDDDAKVIYGLRDIPETRKIKRNFKNNIESLSKSIEQFNTFIPADEECEEIKLPFDTTEFSEAWDDYKEFLLGVFKIALIPVEEKRRLKRIYRFADRDEKKAIDLIDFLMTGRYKSIFKPTDFQLTGEMPAKENEGSGDEATFTIEKTTL